MCVCVEVVCGCVACGVWCGVCEKKTEKKDKPKKRKRTETEKKVKNEKRKND